MDKGILEEDFIASLELAPSTPSSPARYCTVQWQGFYLPHTKAMKNINPLITIYSLCWPFVDLCVYYQRTASMLYRSRNRDLQNFLRGAIGIFVISIFGILVEGILLILVKGILGIFEEV